MTVHADGRDQERLETLLSRRFGVSLVRDDVERALDALRPTHPSSAALPRSEAALYDAADFGEDVDAYRRQVLDAVTAYAVLVNTAYSTAEVAALLGVDPSRVRQRIKERSVWAIKDRGDWVFPALQFETESLRAGLISGLDKVFQAVPEGLHPLAIEGLLTAPQDELRRHGTPVTILHWLRTGGEVARALETVERLHWASM
ncbi:DNA-binding protein [Rhodococcoides yunnanense]|jgi:hypothetical protein|uniref:DNA-binding protein n=1 Tax=Rhodococcoides yunnanense TaxID=278209 RepID=UPI0022B14C1F|nr:DNA-binding protein [Rhodococcus yunnanensis]MCZ4278775.1 DNA-binding protein [Rhodococcus yunnanensis]